MSYSATFDGITYTVVFSRRSSIGVSLSPLNQVVVRAPSGMPRAKIEMFLADKRGWLRRHMAANSAAADMLGEVLSYKKILIGGSPFGLVFDGGDAFDGAIVHASDMRALKNLYIENFGPSFIERVRAFSAVCGLRAESLSFKSYRRLWGCCDGRYNITFNYKLLMLPKVLQDYVAAHELCHTVFHDHSLSFHRLLKGVFPQSRECAKQLKAYAAVARLY